MEFFRNFGSKKLVECQTTPAKIEQPMRSTEECKEIIEDYKAEIKEIGYDFADMIAQQHGLSYHTEYLRNMQPEFEIAVARLTELTQAEIHALVGHFYYLKLTDYARISRESTEDAAAVLDTFKRHVSHHPDIVGQDLETARETMGEMNVQRGLAQNNTYEYTTPIDDTYTTTDAALRRLREVSPEAEHQLRGIENMSMRDLVATLEAAVKHPSIQKHLADYGGEAMREIHNALHWLFSKRANDFYEYGYRSVQNVIQYTPGAPEPFMSLIEHARYLAAQLDDEEAIQKRALIAKEQRTKEAKIAESFELFLFELEHYAKNGPSPIPTPVKDTVGIQNVGELDPVALTPFFRTLIQTVPQSEMKRFVYGRKSDIHRLIWEWGQSAWEHTQLAALLNLFLHTGNFQWRDSERGRDKFAYLKHDASQHVASTRSAARQGMNDIRKQVRRMLSEKYEQDVQCLYALQDYKDLDRVPHLRERLDRLGNALHVPAISDYYDTVLSHAKNLHDEIQAQLEVPKNTDDAMAMLYYNARIKHPAAHLPSALAGASSQKAA